MSAEMRRKSFYLIIKCLQVYFYVSKCSVDITATREHEMLFPLASSDLF